MSDKVKAPGWLALSSVLQNLIQVRRVTQRAVHLISGPSGCVLNVRQGEDARLAGNEKRAAELDATKQGNSRG